MASWRSEKTKAAAVTVAYTQVSPDDDSDGSGNGGRNGGSIRRAQHRPRLLALTWHTYLLALALL